MIIVCWRDGFLKRCLRPLYFPNQACMEAATTRSTARGLYATHGKRWFDVVLSAIGLFLFGIPMLGVGWLIWLVDGSPVLFRQKRVGQNGELFAIYKFRTMTNRPATGTSVTVAGDARVTSFGKWLRRFKLDELPQLLNVLKGDMSFVGPRPDVPGYLDRLRGEEARLRELRPGITGPASLAFRNEEDLLAEAPDPVAFNDRVLFPEKVRLNLEYMKRISFSSDVGYILKTMLPGHEEPAQRLVRESHR
jgi:lipopolysaccharide/colanic/teichoic acid biosynthesis glycosyltransferase